MNWEGLAAHATDCALTITMTNDVFCSIRYRLIELKGINGWIYGGIDERQAHVF